MKLYNTVVVDPPSPDATKTCSRCRESKSLTEFGKNRRTKDGYQHECRLCRHHVARERDRRDPERVAAKNARKQRRRFEIGDRFYTANPYARPAHYYVRVGLKTGDLARPLICDECSQPGRIEAHHDDYSRPLEVRWLCGSCHRLHHLEPGAPD